MSEWNFCSVCFTNSEDVKTSCDHKFCKDCLNRFVRLIKQYPIPCLVCAKPLQDNECEENLDEGALAALKEVKAHAAYLKDKNKIDCYNPDCSGLFDSKGTEVDSFICAECGQKTCLKCWATHAPEEACDEWKANNPDIMANRRFMAKENKLQERCGHGMACPECGTFNEKFVGCQTFLCCNCRLALCLKTKQRRWGPKGFGDYSAGCKCMQDGKTRCHPRCKGCTHQFWFE